MSFREGLKAPIVCPDCGHENLSVAERLEDGVSGNPYICYSCGKHNREALEEGKERFIEEATGEVSGDGKDEFDGIPMAHLLTENEKHLFKHGNSNWREIEKKKEKITKEQREKNFQELRRDFKDNPLGILFILSIWGLIIYFIFFE